MSAPPSPWTPADPDAVGPSAVRDAPVVYSDAPPLGGAAPVVPTAEPRSDRKELVLTASLLVASLVAGATTLMPWRDYGQRFGSTAVETGWNGLGDSIGRGWVIMSLAVLIAVSGVLIAAGRSKAGRVLGVLSGSMLVVASILEWGLGAGGARSGPGIGLWIDLAVGVFVIVMVGALGPFDD